ncbi:kinetochore scaffold 1 [Biomphalaria glabrata]|nr:kinetochore scaffold 1-like [Biomphalaria glabrata]
MYTDKSSNERKKKSENRRSSILKKQDTFRFENTEGISDGPRTPRRVSFASTYTIKHFNPIPWHNSVSDESSSSSGTNHETFTSALESNETFQKINTTACVNQDTCHQLEENGFQNLDVRLTDCVKESDRQPHINCTIVFSDKDETGCMMETTANISQLSASLDDPDIDSVFFHKDLQETGAESTNISEAKKPKILDNLFALIKKGQSVDETECLMETTANISQLSTLLEQPALDSVFVVEDMQEITQETAYISEATKPKILDNLFALIKKDESVDEVECMKERTAFDKDVHETTVERTNISEAKKPKILDNLFALIKKDEYVDETECMMETTANISQLSTLPEEPALDSVFVVEDMQEITQETAYISEVTKPKILNNLFALIKNDESVDEVECMMEMTAFDKDVQETTAERTNISEAKKPKFLDNSFTLIKKDESVDETECMMETTANISQLSTSLKEPAIDSVFFKDIQETTQATTNISEAVKPRILDNLFALIKKDQPIEDVSSTVMPAQNRISGMPLSTISKFDMTPIKEISLTSTNHSLSEPRKGLSVMPISSQALQLSQIGLKLDKVVDRSIATKEISIHACEKENYPVLSIKPKESNQTTDLQHVDLGVQSVGKLHDGQLINEDLNTSSILSIDKDSKVAVSKMSNQTVSNVELQIQNTISDLAQHAVTCSEKESMRKSVLKDLSHQLSLTQPLNLGKRKSTNFNLILGNKKKRLAPVTTISGLQSSNCESPKSFDNITTNLNFISPERPFQISNFDEGMSPLPDIFGQTPTITTSEAKSKIREPIEDYDDLELLGNQEMPELANSDDNSFTESTQSLYKLPTSNLNQQHNLEKFKSATSVSDLLVSLGIKHTRNVPNKVISFVNIPLSSVQDQLKTLLTFVPKAEVLSHYLANIESSKELCLQESKQKLAECVEEPAAYTYFSTNDPINKKKLLEMIEASKLLARSKWKKMKANHLLKYYTDREAVHEAFNVEVRDVLAATESILAVTSDIDKRLNEIDFLLQDHKETTELTSCENENAELRLRCLELTNSVERLQAENDCSLRRSSDSLQRVHSISGILQWMNRMTEWSLLKSTENELEFGFLWQTVVLHIDYSQSSRRIVQVSIRQHLSESSKPWAKLAVTYAVSSINCQQLLETYPNISQMNQLLQDVSTVMFLSRQLSTELKYAFLNHYVTIDKNSLTVVLSDRLTCQKISMTASLVPNSYPYQPLNWIITPLIGHTSLEAVHKAIESIPGGDQYFTQLLAAVQLCMTTSLAQH